MRIPYACSVGLFVLAACSSGPRDAGSGSSALQVSAKDGCACALDQICDASGSVAACIARPVPAKGESFAQVELLSQLVPVQQNLLAKLGKATASFNAAEALPVDARQKFTTNDGEDCFFEVGSNYPSSYNGQSWPSTPGLDAGTLTFTVDGGRSAIELDPVQYQSDTGYFHNKSLPPALEDGSAVYPDFFDPSYLPSNHAATMHIAGGSQVAAADLGAQLPPAFAITEPAVESGTVSGVSGADLSVSWSSPEPTAYMEIFVTMFKGDVTLLSCKVKDDGHAVIPGAAMNPFYGDVGLQLRRTTERYTRLVGRDGKVVHAFVAGRHARIGNLSLALP
jgi:hypothetical protein